MRRARVSKPCVWRWQERFMREGIADLLREKTRKPGSRPLSPVLVERVVALTLSDRTARRRTRPVGQWPRRPVCRCARCNGSGQRTVCSRTGYGASSCRRIRLLPPSCAMSVGLYLDPPAHSIVLSVDEKSQIQALDRTQLPVK